VNAEVPKIQGTSQIDLPQYVDEILRSGFPGIRSLPDVAREAQLDGYIDRIVERELPINDVVVRHPTIMKQWLSAYAAATSTDATYSKILDAATPGESNKPASATIIGYRDQLTRLFLLDPLEAWTPTFSPLNRLTKTPKHHLVDPALAARIVGVGASGLLQGGGVRVTSRPPTATWLGALFESLVVQSVRVYAQAVRASVGHLRTQNTQQEIDLILEGRDRNLVAIEIKASGSVTDHDVRHLNWLKAQLGDRVVDRICINAGPHAYRRPDGVAVIPFALLGP